MLPTPTQKACMLKDSKPVNNWTGHLVNKSKLKTSLRNEGHNKGIFGTVGVNSIIFSLLGIKMTYYNAVGLNV